MLIVTIQAAAYREVLTFFSKVRPKIEKKTKQAN